MVIFMVHIGNDWDTLLKDEFTKPYYLNLRNFIAKEYRTTTVYPDMYDIFNALKYTSYQDCRVVILGQDPYHQQNQAHGLSFSVRKGVKIPPSLRNIYKELSSDLGIVAPTHGCLIDWAKQGVFMINAIMSVEEGKAGSHRKKGWETFSDHVMDALNAHVEPIVFVFWGNWAKEKASRITNPKHMVLCSAHPSPLSAFQGFFGSKPFSKINAFLKEHQRDEIDWRLFE